MRVESHLTFLDLWSAASAQLAFSETPMETMQGWFDAAGVGVNLTAVPQALVVREPQPDVLWSASVPGTRALSNLWIIALTAALLCCVAWGYFQRHTGYSKRRAEATRRSAFLSAAFCSFLLFLILIGVWRSRMAPIYDGVAYTPYVSAPPPPPPPISGFEALNHSLGLLDLARRECHGTHTLIFHPLSSSLTDPNARPWCDRHQRALRRGLQRRALRLVRGWTLHELKVHVPYLRRR